MSAAAVSTGDCFHAAVSTAKDLLARGVERVLVVHGKPVATGGPAEGKRYWHAWVEAKLDDGWEVFDRSNGKRVRLRRADYYRIGRIGPAHGGPVPHRYSPADVARYVVRLGHSGPWVTYDETEL